MEQLSLNHFLTPADQVELPKKPCRFCGGQMFPLPGNGQSWGCIHLSHRFSVQGELATWHNLSTGEVHREPVPAWWPR